MLERHRCLAVSRGIVISPLWPAQISGQTCRHLESVAEQSLRATYYTRGEMFNTSVASQAYSQSYWPVANTEWLILFLPVAEAKFNNLSRKRFICGAFTDIM